MSQHQFEINNGLACLSCFDPMPTKSPGHPRDCDKCKSRQLSDKRACPQCGSAVRGVRGMRDHWRQAHSPVKQATPEQIQELKEAITTSPSNIKAKEWRHGR